MLLKQSSQKQRAKHEKPSVYCGPISAVTFQKHYPFVLFLHFFLFTQMFLQTHQFTLFLNGDRTVSILQSLNKNRSSQVTRPSCTLQVSSSSVDLVFISPEALAALKGPFLVGLTASALPVLPAFVLDPTADFEALSLQFS